MLRWIMQRAGKRGACLLFWGYLHIIIGLVFLEPPTDVAARNLYWILKILPSKVIAVLWFLSGVVCMVGAFWKRRKKVAIAFGPFMPLAFAAAYIASWITGHS